MSGGSVQQRSHTMRQKEKILVFVNNKAIINIAMLMRSEAVGRSSDRK